MGTTDLPPRSSSGSAPSGAAASARDRQRRDDVARDRLFALSLDLLSVASFDGWFQQVNPAWTRCLGWTADELMSRPLIEFVHPDDRERTLAVRDDIRSGRAAREFDNRYRCKDGSYRWLSWNVYPSLETQQVFGVARDVTERRRFEAQLQRAQRLESLATLAGGFAHDLNNVFAPILMAIDLLPLDLEPAERAEILASVEASARRGARLVGQVLAFARGVDGARVDVDLGQLLEPLLADVCAQAGPDVTVEVDGAPDLHRIVGDPQQLADVVRSLCENACTAMPHGGRLFVTAANVDGPASGDTAGGAGASGPAVAITVQDSGTGMTADVQARIFEPFFTTREFGEATGLGLSAALAIVQSHGGRIDVRSAPGDGSTFTVVLPAHVEPPAAASQGPPPRVRGRGELVLVVDDEATVRLMMRHALEAGGYRVLLAADGAEALATFRAHAAEVALVVTDMRLPVMTGAQTLAALRQLAPGVRCLLSTGASEDATDVGMPDEPAIPVLRKPFTTEALLGAVHAALAGRSTD